jgi:phosphoribosylcarboxyaminoimidazole (NCAIR) mutase
VIAGVFYGGLAFALPGVFAAEAFALPVVAVPSDEDAFFNVYKIIHKC